MSSGCSTIDDLHSTMLCVKSRHIGHSALDAIHITSSDLLLFVVSDPPARHQGRFRNPLPLGDIRPDMSLEPVQPNN